jgi:hypothetical protein
MSDIFIKEIIDEELEKSAEIIREAFGTVAKRVFLNYKEW